MTKIKGQNLRVMVNGNCVAYATTCTFHVAAQTEDSSTKDSTGDWAESEVTGLSWDAQAESLVTLADADGGATPVSIMSLMISKTLVTVTFDQTNGDKNRVGQNAAIKRTGTAYITDVNITAANRQNSTFSVQFTGTGPLA